MTLGGRVKKEAATPTAKPELDELEEYLEEPEETDLEVNLLLWSLVAGQGVQVAGACQDGLAALRGACLICWRRARLLRRRQDAWRPPEVGQGLDDARTLLICSFQY